MPEKQWKRRAQMSQSRLGRPRRWLGLPAGRGWEPGGRSHSVRAFLASNASRRENWSSKCWWMSVLKEWKFCCMLSDELRTCCCTSEMACCCWTTMPRSCCRSSACLRLLSPACWNQDSNLRPCSWSSRTLTASWFD